MFIPSKDILQTDSGPIEVIDQEQNLFNGILGTYGKGRIAQSFIPTLDKLTKIYIRLSREGNPDSIIISIRNNLQNADIASVTILGEDISTEAQWLEIQFEDCIYLTPNNPGYIIFYPQGTTHNDQFYLSFQDNNPYKNGCVWQQISYWEKLESEGDYHDIDLSFKTYGLNYPPDKPTINGPSTGAPGITYTYTIQSHDPENHDLYYCIDWGDGTGENCMGPKDSGEVVSLTHVWTEEGVFILEVTAWDDPYNLESDKAILEIHMPKQKTLFSCFDFLKDYPMIYSLITSFFKIIDDLNIIDMKS
jgi:hypothetical protein